MGMPPKPTPKPQQGLPKGVILPWFSKEQKPPAGWEFCDGSAGRPNLDGRWLTGTSDPTKVGQPIGGGPVTLEFSGNATPTPSQNKYPVSGSAGDPPHAPGMDHTHGVSGTLSINDPLKLAPPSVMIRYIIKT